MPTPPLSGGRTPTKPHAEEPPGDRTHTPVVSSPNPPRLANAKRPGPPAPSLTLQRLSSSTPSSSSRSSPQQEPGSAQYLDRLLRLARCRRTLRSSSSSAMADFLASFNLGAQTPAASSNPQCDSVQDLQLRLRGALDAKVTPNRAEHLSITLELGATVRFELSVSEPENGALDNLNNIDPLMGGMRSASVAADQAGGQLSRVVFANDTLMNQPQDDPALQRSVAKHIIGLVSATDGSTWTVREVSRGSQGWTFTYLCKDSYQQWNRQTSKNPTKAIVGEFSQRDPDPVLHARPAFDCRGSVTIAFNRNSRAITVKYDHTPMHKTVAQLAEYFKPLPRQLGPGAQKLQQQKTKENTPKKAKGEKRERKKRETKAQDENGNPRKRKKKNDGAAQATAPADGPMIPPDYPGAPPIDGQGGLSYAAGEQTDGTVQNQQGFSDYPQGLMGDAPAAANGSTTQTRSQPPSVIYPVNVSAAEAARRREAALTMLSNAGVEPSTLSAEQFNIFSNQAPELQRESLGMLVKYGAERLRIVHPGNREGSAQTNASASTTSSQTTPSGPMTTKELVPQSGAQSNVGTDNEAPTSTEAEAAAEAPETAKRDKRKKMAKSRTACFPCKARKTKCPKERPTCTECESHGTACEYAPQKPRNKKKKPEESETIVVEDDEDEEDEEEEEQQQEDAEEDAPEEEDSTQQDASQDYSYPQMNIENMVTTTDTTSQDLQTSQNGYYQPPSGLSLPQPDPYSNTQQPMTADPGLVMPPRQTYNTGMPEVTQPPPPAPAPAGTIAPIESRRWTAIGPGNKTRRSLPSEPVHSNGQNVPAANPQPSDWAQSSNNTMPATNVSSLSPQMAYSRSANQQSRQVNQNVSRDHSQMADGMQQATAVSNTVMQQARQSPVAAAAMIAQARKSPYQQAAVPRATSRQSQQNQSRTPEADQTRGYQPPADMGHQHNTRSSARHDTSQMTNNSGYGEYGRYSSTNTAASHQSSHRGYDQTNSMMQQNTDTTSQTAAMAMSLASGTPSTMSTSYPAITSSANQWSSSSGRNDRSYGSNSSYHDQSAYSQPASSKPGSTSRQNFNMRGSTQQDTRTSSSSSYGQQQRQNYPSYSGPTQQSQTGNQPSSWYFQGSHSSSLNPGSQSSGYSYESWSGV
ncbi:ATP-dependent DNA helicase II subunit 1 [Fusarium falciforme]|nr:ATP-dependent DNA helicase II subunit 1 [Fusarium falciforme]